MASPPTHTHTLHTAHNHHHSHSMTFDELQMIVQQSQKYVLKVTFHSERQDIRNISNSLYIDII
jgi:RNA processing factor Prp31